jgi:hypothetical protein
MPLLTGPPRHPRRRAASAAAFLASVVVLVVLVMATGGAPGGPAGGSVGGSSSGAAPDRLDVGERTEGLGPDSRPSPVDGYRRVDAHRAPTVPAAVLAASVLLAGWAAAHRFVPLTRPPVRSWTGGRAGRVRAPPLPAV